MEKRVETMTDAELAAELEQIDDEDAKDDARDGQIDTAIADLTPKMRILADRLDPPPPAEQPAPRPAAVERERPNLDMDLGF